MTINTDQRVESLQGLKWRGIGFKTSLALARNGFLTFATMRNLKASRNENLLLQAIILDADNEKSVIGIIEYLRKRR